MSWYKKAKVYGEWWIDDNGQILYADNNYSHEGQVTKTIMSQYFELDGINGPSLLEIQNMSVEEFAERGMEPDEIKVIRGEIDAREFAMKNWGWVRVAGKYVQAWVLDSKTLKRIANGLWEAFDNEVLRSTFVIENISSGKNYSQVPYAAIESGNPMALREYQEWEPIALGSSNWYKKADITDYDRDRLESTGHEINETVRIGDYDLSLVTLQLSPILMIPQVALAYRGLSFTDPSVQQERRQLTGVPNLDLEGMRGKLSEWINKVGKLYFSTHNLGRIETYQSILQHLGFNVKAERVSGQSFLTIGEK